MLKRLTFRYQFGLYLLTMLILISCNNQRDIENIPKVTLESTLNKNETIEIDNSELGIYFSYPENWVVYNEDPVFIRIAEKESYFPWKDYSSSHPDYHLYALFPFDGSRQWAGSSMSAMESASFIEKEITNDRLAEIVEPVIPVNVNGNDGALFVLENKNTVYYTVVLQTSKDKSIVISGNGPSETLEEIKSVVNAIALSIKPIGES